MNHKKITCINIRTLLLIIIAGFFIEFLSVCAPAQEVNLSEDLYGIPIVSVRLVGLKHLDPNELRARVHTRKGEFVSPLRIRQDIRRLAETGLFRDIQVEALQTPLGLEIKFVLTENRSISKLIFVGNKKIKSEKLKKECGFEENEIFSPKKLKLFEEKLRQYYIGKGYHSSAVTGTVIDDSSETVVLSFAIDEGRRTKVVDVKVEGVKSFSTKKIRGFMRSRPGWANSIFPKRYNPTQVQMDMARIEDFYQNKGYLKVKVTELPAQVGKKGRKLTIRIKVDEGDQYSVGSKNIDGTTVYEKEDLLKMIESKEGDIYNFKKVRTEINNIRNKYSNNGYITSEIHGVPKFREDEKVADIDINVIEGPQVRVGNIKITGLCTDPLDENYFEECGLKTKDHVILRELNLKTGDILALDRLRRSEQKLRLTGFFDGARIIPRNTLSPEIMDLDVSVIESRTGQFSFNFGYADREKFVMGLDFSEKNFFGNGQNVSISTQVGSRSNTGEISFYDPHIYNSEYSFRAEAHRRVFEDDDYEIKRLGGSITFGRPIAEYIKAYLRFRIQQVELTEEEDVDFITPEELGKNRINTVKLTFVRDNRDESFFPSDGSLHRFGVEYGAEIFGSDFDFIKYTAEANWYYPIFSEKVIYALHAELGVADALAETASVPIFERFFLGGDRTVRGYGYKDVGPKDLDGASIGGSSQFLFKNELRIPLSPRKFYWINFVDAGGVWEDVTDMDLNELQYGVGTGFRIFIPGFGLIGLDYAWALDSEPDESNSRFHFSVGSAF